MPNKETMTSYLFPEKNPLKEGLEPVAEGDGWQGDRGNPSEDRDEGCGAEGGECPHGVAPVGLPDDEAKRNAEGGCGHKPTHNDGEGAAAFVG